jgi:DNA repair exonuclease SbcCD ATPase subunit
MGLFDRVFGKREAAEKETILSREHALGELCRLRKETLAIEEAPAICREAASEIEHLKRAAKEFSAKEIEPGVAGYKIAAAMRSNFSSRVPKVLEEITPPKEYGYGDVSAFQQKLERALVEMTKATSDNRYLFALFQGDMRNFATHAKALAALSQRLREKLQEKTDAERKITAAEKAIGEITRSKQNLEKNKAELEKLEQETKRLESEAERAAQASEAERREAEGLRREVSSAEAKAERVRARVAQRFSVLPRVLRKFGKVTADGELEKLAVRYAEPALAFREDRGAGLRRLLPAIEAALNEGSIEKDSRAASKIASELRKLEDALSSGVIERELAEAGSLEEHADRLRQEVEGRVLRSRKHEAVVEELNAAKARKAFLEEGISTEGKNEGSAKARAEEILGELLRSKITIS